MSADAVTGLPNVVRSSSQPSSDGDERDDDEDDQWCGPSSVTSPTLSVRSIGVGNGPHVVGFGQAMVMARASCDRPIVATSRITRGAREQPAHDDELGDRAEGGAGEQPDEQRERSTGRRSSTTSSAMSDRAGEAHVRDGEVDDPCRPVDEDEAHREQAVHQPVDTPVGDDCWVSVERRHSVDPRNTARARSSRSASSRAGPVEADRALLEEDGPVGDGERDVQGLLDDHHRLPGLLEPLEVASSSATTAGARPRESSSISSTSGSWSSTPTEGQLLLLAARQRPAPAGRAVARGREQLVDPLDPLGPQRAGRGPGRPSSRLSATLSDGNVALAAGQQLDAHAAPAARAT